VPHSAQNFPLAAGVPQDGHRRVNAVPHSAQNFSVGAFSCPQVVQTCDISAPPIEEAVAAE